MTFKRSGTVAKAASLLLAVLVASCSDDSSDPSCTQHVWSYDQDGDGYRQCIYEPVTSCDAPTNAPAGCPSCPVAAWRSGDEALPCGECNDTNAALHPGVTDLCDGIDNDCNGALDTGCACIGSETRSCGPDTATGECVLGVQTCVAGAWGECVGEVLAADEICDGLDNDCDGEIDDGCDDDDDNYCDASMAMVGTPPTCTAGGGDCADNAASIRPGVPEAACDDVDEDCDGVVDEGCDDDGDGYCDLTMTNYGYAAICPGGAGDCNDSDASVHIGATETCNGRDDNCNSVVDDAAWKFGGAAAGTACYAAVPLPSSFGPFYVNTILNHGDGDFAGHGPEVLTTWVFEVASGRLRINVGLSALEVVPDQTHMLGLGKTAAIPSAYDGKIVDVLGTERMGEWHSTSSCKGADAVLAFPQFPDWQLVYVDGGSSGVKTGFFQFPSWSCGLRANYSCLMNTPGDDWGEAYCSFASDSGNSVWIQRTP